MGKGSLKIFELNTQQERDYYNSIYDRIGSKSIFNSLDFVLASKSDSDSTKYFVYCEENTPRILMLFHYRRIYLQGEPTEFFDVISPYGYSGPIYKDDLEDHHLKEFWGLADSWYRKNNVVSEFIRFGLGTNHYHYTGALVPTLKTVRGKILDPETQWKNFKKKVRNNVRKAIKNELQCKIEYLDFDSRSIADYYNIYIDTLNRHKAHKRYYFSLDYFKNLIVRNKENCALAIVRKDGIAISAELLLLSRDTIFSHLGGTSAEHFALRPNDFLKVSVLDWGRSKGFKYYNLGGGQAKEDSLYQYKRSFFPKDSDVIYFTGRKIINDSIYSDLVKALPLDKPEEPLEVESVDQGFFPIYRILE